jgi:hypothetical protein
MLSGAGSVLFGTCGPFTDTAADAFCPFIQEVFFLGITTGTTPTTWRSYPFAPFAAFSMRSATGFGFET